MNKNTKRIMVRMALGLAALLVVIIIAASVILCRTVSMVKSDDPYVWLPEIEAFEEQDKIEPPPQNAIVFTGSSSIRLWDDLEEDMSPLPVFQRGFGGAKINDVVYFADRIVLPYDPVAVVLFAGSNDLAGYDNDSTPEEILSGFMDFVETLHAGLPGVPVYYISITPTRLRWKQWPLARQTNELIESYTLESEHLYFIDTTDLFLNKDGKPDHKLFTYDMLHLNRKGYEAWTTVIKPILQKKM